MGNRDLCVCVYVYVCVCVFIGIRELNPPLFQQRIDISGLNLITIFSNMKANTARIS